MCDKFEGIVSDGSGIHEIGSITLSMEEGDFVLLSRWRVTGGRAK